jgi:hypothetical protein
MKQMMVKLLIALTVVGLAIGLGNTPERASGWSAGVPQEIYLGGVHREVTKDGILWLSAHGWLLNGQGIDPSDAEWQLAMDGAVVPDAVHIFGKTPMLAVQQLEEMLGVPRYPGEDLVFCPIEPWKPCECRHVLCDLLVEDFDQLKKSHDWSRYKYWLDKAKEDVGNDLRRAMIHAGYAIHFAEDRVSPSHLGGKWDERDLDWACRPDGKRHTVWELVDEAFMLKAQMVGLAGEKCFDPNENLPRKLKDYRDLTAGEWPQAPSCSDIRRWGDRGNSEFDDRIGKALERASMLTRYILADVLDLEPPPACPADPGECRPGENVDVALIIDNSGSMSWNDPGPPYLRREAASVFIDNAQDGDHVGIVAFTSSSNLLWDIVDNGPLGADRTSIKNSLAALGATDGTSLSAGLGRGYEQLLKAESTGHKKAAVFLTDGVGSYDDEALDFADAGWPIYVLGLGSDIDEPLLQRIAEDSHGQYAHLDSADQLVSVYFDINRQIACGDTQHDSTQRLSQGETKEATVEIPPNQLSASFMTDWSGSTVDTCLQEPGLDGRLICEDSTGDDIYHAKGQAYELYRISSPRPGAWSVQLFGAQLPPEGEDVAVKVTTVPSPDSAAPATEISSTGTLGDYGWYVSPATVTLSSEDNDSGKGVDWAAYSLDDGGSWMWSFNDANASPFVNQFQVSDDFVGEVWAMSADWADPPNIEDPPARLPLKVDVTAPTVTVVGSIPGEEAEDDLELAATASDATSGVDGVYFYVREDDGGDGTAIGHEAMAAAFNSAAGQWDYSFDASDLGPGDYIVLASATDEAGNEGWSDAVPFSVSPAPTPTPTPTPTPKPSPTALASVSVPMVAGWNDKCYVGEEKAIEAALGDIADNVQAVYILDSAQEWDRWFPDRTDVSTITTLKPYDQLFVLASTAANWIYEQSSDQQASVGLIQGWNSVCYTGQAKVVQEATESIAGKFGILYRFLNTQVWARYVPERPDLSDISQLQQYDSVLVLVAEAGATWAFDP